jgi:hypothetical protein
VRGLASPPRRNGPPLRVREDGRRAKQARGCASGRPLPPHPGATPGATPLLLPGGGAAAPQLRRPRRPPLPSVPPRAGPHGAPPSAIDRLIRRRRTSQRRWSPNPPSTDKWLLPSSLLQPPLRPSPIAGVKLPCQVRRRPLPCAFLLRCFRWIRGCRGSPGWVHAVATFPG